MTNTIKIKTNNHVRPLVSFYDIPVKSQEMFDYVNQHDRNNPRFVKYRGEWYDAGDAEIAGHDAKSQGFDGVAVESAFSAVFFRYYDKDGDLLDYGYDVVVGYASW